MIPYGRQDITAEDIEAVAAVLRSDFLTQGPAVPRFERAVAERVHARHGVAFNSATSALHAACIALGLGPGEWLWTSPITFVASANCALYCGAQVDFVDIDPHTYNMSPEALQKKLEGAKTAGKLPKVVVPVHFSGQSCDMEAIHALAREYGFRVVEDASHAIGGRYQGGMVGGCKYSDITIFSFHPVKIVTSGEGGMAMTNDPQLAHAMDLARSHGITRDPERMQGAAHGPWYYEQIALGFNYRMTDIHAALGLSQLQRLEDYVERRQQIATRYDAELHDVPVIRPYRGPECISALHLYVVKIVARTGGPTRADVFATLRAAGIGANVHYIPVHMQPYYQALGHRAGDYPQAEAYYAQAITLPLHAKLTEQDQDHVVATLKKALQS